MTLTGIYGFVGSGKDVISVIDCANTPKEIPIYTNFDLRLKNADKIEPEEIFDVFSEDSKIPIKKMVTTELYGWLENRGSGFSDLNKYISYMIFQSRKRGLNWTANAQLRGTVDLRWRGLENIVIYAHERNLDMSGNSTDDFHYSIIKNMRVVNLTLEYEMAKQFFDIYSTKEVVMPQGFNELSMKIKFKKHPELLNEYINSIADKVMKKYTIPNKELKNGTIKYSVTEDWIRDKLLEMNLIEAMEYSKYVKFRIKGKLEID